MHLYGNAMNQQGALPKAGSRALVYTPVTTTTLPLRLNMSWRLSFAVASIMVAADDDLAVDVPSQRLTGQALQYLNVESTLA